jgi:hypothetical protein
LFRLIGTHAQTAGVEFRAARAHPTPTLQVCDIVPRVGSEDYERTLGVAEAITLAGKQCPNAHVRSCADAALDAIKSGGGAAIEQQVYLVLSAMQGWRGDRASQIHRSLSAFLKGSASARKDRAGSKSG